MAVLRSSASQVLAILEEAQTKIFSIFGIFGRAKYGQVGCPLKDLAKCSSDALALGQKDPPVKSYDQIKILADFPIVRTPGIVKGNNSLKISHLVWFE